MKTTRTLTPSLLVSHKVGRVTPSTLRSSATEDRCAPQFNNARTARRGLTRPTTPRSWSAPLVGVHPSGCPLRSITLKRGHRTAGFLFIAALTALCPLLLYPTSARAQGGVPLWTNRYESGGWVPRIAVDASGNVFVAGYSRNASVPGSQDCATIAYSNAGVPRWTNSFPIPNGGNVNLAADSTGNVFVSTSSGLVKYSNSGVPLWTNQTGGPIATDSVGNVFVTDSFYTAAYSSSGVLLWTNRYIGPVPNGANAWAIAVDSSNNVLVAGGSGGSDYATVKYSNSGVPLWTNLYGGPGNDTALAIAVDGSGNAFVTGSSLDTNFVNSDWVTIKYSNSGLPLWTNRYNGPGNSFEDVPAIAVDNSGNAFVTGNSGGDYATIKYSNAGALLWTRRYNGPGNDADGAYAIAVDSAGNVFVTGVSPNSSGNSDFATVAYSNAGLPLWTKRFNGSANGDDASYAIALDHNGNVFVSGSSWNGASDDFVTIKCSSSVPPPRLDFQMLNNELVLSWTNAGFNLQTAPAVTGPFTNLPAATSPYTNPLAAPQQFFRLASP